jgi:hypothetical protein
MSTSFRFGLKPEGRYHSEDIGVDGMVLLWSWTLHTTSLITTIQRDCGLVSLLLESKNKCNCGTIATVMVKVVVAVM